MAKELLEKRLGTQGVKRICNESGIPDGRVEKFEIKKEGRMRKLDVKDSAEFRDSCCKQFKNPGKWVW